MQHLPKLLLILAATIIGTVVSGQAQAPDNPVQAGSRQVPDLKIT
ncbi:hypothetical protein [Limosilactobacillus pontis]|nr:hypothetical protein [Limosilactobacillus pontis]